ncbi:MAG: ATP-binding protein [Bacteroidota bacterium]
MDLTALELNGKRIHAELQWLTEIIQSRMESHFNSSGSAYSIADQQMIKVDGDESVFGQFVRHYEFNVYERLVLILALAPHVMPEALDVFWVKNKNTLRGYTEFGGLASTQFNGFLPTGQTAAFLIGGNEISARLFVQSLFTPGHIFKDHQILKLEEVAPGEPQFSGQIKVTDEILAYLIEGREYRPQYSSNFPARRIETALEWNDLIIDQVASNELESLKTWMSHRSSWLKESGLDRFLKPGYRALFHGPPGTGKTLTASLLGQFSGMPVYRVDLSRMVSKYIGETEKNLERVFEVAEDKDWILFFDEADALFGKRTATSDAKDRYANQEIAYLLQRIEGFRGMVILATNLKANLDPAFSRRFQSIIHFPMPGASERLKIWTNILNACTIELEAAVDLDELARKYELSGGSINNVVQSAVLLRYQFQQEKLTRAHLMMSIRKEFQKMGRTVS